MESKDELKEIVCVIIFMINFARIRIDSYNSVPMKKTLTFHNVIILIKSVDIH